MGVVIINRHRGEIRSASDMWQVMGWLVVGAWVGSGSCGCERCRSVVIGIVLVIIVDIVDSIVVSVVMGTDAIQSSAWSRRLTLSSSRRLACWRSRWDVGCVGVGLVL